MHQGHGRHLHPEVGLRSRGARLTGAPSIPDATPWQGQQAPALTRPWFGFSATGSPRRAGPDRSGRQTADALERGCRTTSQTSQRPAGQGASQPRPAGRAHGPMRRICRIERPCLAGQRDRPADRARRLSARHHPAQRGEMGRDLQCQPLGGARSDQDADGQEPAGITPQDRQLGRAEGALEPARSRRAGLVRDRARPRSLPAHGAGVPPHHRAGSVRLCRACGAPTSRWPRSARPAARWARRRTCRSARAPTRASTSPSCGASGNDLLVPLGVLIESALDHLFVFTTRAGRRPRHAQKLHEAIEKNIRLQRPAAARNAVHKLLANTDEGIGRRR